ncbi:MAG: c-type cytochrome [Allorhizobium sp.]|jgi:cytochrome c556|uniref:Cytochrome C556 n=1 Tax=Rhizobium rosettiformans TaxID=1368430 RepID=A0ABX7EXF5_9HYPH|nr:cytochrome c [Rhizobium rosettiformans]QRF52081.1 cytochrome C556 [Rhizobium rosettiformans]
MKLKLVLSAATAICLGVTAAIAAGEPQAVRQEEMKKVGGAMGALGAIAKGEKPYDAEAVTAALTTLAEVGKTFPDHFPAGSETGMDSEAAPAIWQNMDDFKAKSAKLASAAEAQLATLPADQAGVAAAMQAVGATCGDCHQTYRLKK